MMASPLRSPLWHAVAAVVVLATMGALGTGASATQRPGRLATQGVDAGSETYRGYRLNLSSCGGAPDGARLRRAAEHQVDIVEATGLDDRTKTFLRRFPVTVWSGSGSHYSGGDGVTIAVEDPGDDRPILLHEFLHAYHVRRLSGGTGNPDIRTFYARARTGGLYPPGAYTLRNPQEFFAMTANVFLHGHLAREPFTHEATWGDGTTVGGLMRDGKGLLVDFDATPALKVLAGCRSARINCRAGSPRDRPGVRAALVRPDGVVAWASDGLPDEAALTHAMARWLGR